MVYHDILNYIMKAYIAEFETKDQVDNLHFTNFKYTQSGHIYPSTDS